MFLAFLFKWAIALTLLFSLYGLLLRRETFYRVNRFVLLAILPLSACLSTIRVETRQAGIATRTMSEVTEWMATPVPAPAAATAAPSPSLPFSSVQLLLYIYIIGVVAVALQYLFALIQVVRIIRQSQPAAEARQGDSTLLLNAAVDSPFSWFRWIVISPADLELGGRIFLAHERAHVRYGHSWDMLLCEFCVRLQWFNPFAWQLREDLRAVHEFQADRSVIRAGCNVREYNMLLIDKALGSQLAPVANALTQSELKGRIRMMHRRPSPWQAMLKVLYIVPFALVTLALFAKPIAVQNIVNARDIDALALGVKTLLDPTLGDAVPASLSAPVSQPSAPMPEAPVEEEQSASLLTPPEQEPAPAPHLSAPNSHLSAPSSAEDPHVAEIKATHDYQRQRAQRAIEEYISLSLNTHKIGAHAGMQATITIDRDGRVTNVSFPDAASQGTPAFDVDEVERHIRTLPRQLTRDYIVNLDTPSESNHLIIHFDVYKQ